MQDQGERALPAPGGGVVDDPRLLNSLPMQLSRFIGREAEVAEVRAMVSGSRLVTLTGAGVAGKTRWRTPKTRLDSCCPGSATTW